MPCRRSTRWSIGISDAGTPWMRATPWVVRAREASAEPARAISLCTCSLGERTRAIDSVYPLGVSRVPPGVGETPYQLAGAGAYWTRRAALLLGRLLGRLVPEPSYKSSRVIAKVRRVADLNPLTRAAIRAWMAWLLAWRPRWAAFDWYVTVLHTDGRLVSIAGGRRSGRGRWRGAHSPWSARRGLHRPGGQAARIRERCHPTWNAADDGRARLRVRRPDLRRPHSSRSTSGSAGSASRTR